MPEANLETKGSPVPRVAVVAAGIVSPLGFGLADTAESAAIV